MPLDPDRLLPPDPATRRIARGLYEGVAGLPIVSPHGHCDPRWFAEDAPFPDPATLFVVPDHYIFRMLHSQGVPLEALGVPRRDGGATERDPRAIWRILAEHWHCFRATPSRMWMEHALQEVFGVTERLGPDTAEAIYDHVDACLKRPEFRPRALFDRFGIEVLATTEAATDDLAHHAAIRRSGWAGRVITTYRPDACVDPDHEGFAGEVERLGAMTGEAATGWEGYLAAHRARRAAFREMGATATDHGHPTPRTEALDRDTAAALFDRALRGDLDAAEADAFRGHMLTEMARMSVEDGMVMQIHAGSWRNTSRAVFERFGRDKGFDIPVRVDWARGLAPMLDAVGHAPGLRVLLFTLDESAYARELAPLAGAWPCLTLGPAWWFHDSYEGMMRYRRMTTETAGLCNTAGFNDDTRAFCSIPARHDVARRVDCAWIAEQVVTGRLDEDEAPEVAEDLAVGLARRAYKL